MDALNRDGLSGIAGLEPSFTDPARDGLLLTDAGEFLFARWAVTRPPTAPDRMIGYRNRAPEIRFAFAVQLFLVCYGGLMLYESMAAMPVFNVQRAFALSVASFVLLGGTGFALGAKKPGRPRTEVAPEA